MSTPAARATTKLVAPALRKAWAGQAAEYAKTLAAAAPSASGKVDERFAALAEAGDLAGLRAHLAETRPTLEPALAEFADKKDVVDQVRAIGNALAEMHAARDAFWKDKPLRAAPLAKEDYDVFRKHVLTPGVVDAVEAAAAKALAGDDKTILERHGQLSEDEKRRLAAVTAAGTTSLEEFKSTLAARAADVPMENDAAVDKVLAQGDAMAEEAAVEIADLEKELEEVKAERDNLLYSVVEDELARDPELLAKLQQDVIDNNWDPEPAQEQSSPASGQSMPW